MTLTLQSPAVSPGRIARAENAAESYKKVEDQILALSASETGRVTADVAIAASIALGALGNLEQLRPDFERVGDGGAAIKALDSLHDYAFAAFFAHLQAAPDANQTELARLLEQARPLRENLLKVAEGLVSFGLLPEATVAAIREGTGNLDIAKDLTQLSALFSSNWERVETKVPFERALVEEAGHLGTLLLRTIGAREVGEVRKEPATDWGSLRARAFRLLVNAYEDLRRATQFVRWKEGDALAYVPSLHARQVPRRKAGGEPSQLEPEPFVSEGAVAADPPASAASGLPGANPFANE